MARPSTAGSDRSRIGVAHLTTVHRPFDVRIFHKQCVTLAAAGYRVALIQQGDAPDVVKGVSILPIKPRGSRIARMTLGVAQAVSRAVKSRAQVIHIHDVELIWGGIVLKLLGRKVVYDVHEDLQKDLDDKAYLPRWAIPPLRLAAHLTEFVATRAFDRISTATSAIHTRFPAAKSQLIRNTPILGELATVSPRPFRDRPPHVAYLGGLAAFNGPDMMIDAMALLPAELDARLVLGGMFPDPVVEAAVRASPGWDRVIPEGWVDRGRIAEIFAAVRCGLIVYQPTPNVVNSEPNKFFEVLSAGLPLVASNFPVWKAFVETYRCGICVDPSDPAEIAAAIEYMLRNPDEAEAMGARGRAAVLDSYNWSQDGARLVAMYDRLTSTDPTPPAQADARA